jgi:hypothetical protein
MRNPETTKMIALRKNSLGFKFSFIVASADFEDAMLSVDRLPTTYNSVEVETVRFENAAVPVTWFEEQKRGPR